LPELVAQQIGVLGMKPLGSGLFFRSQPLAERKVTPIECLQYPMSLPTSVVITGCDTPGIALQAIAAAYQFGAHPPGDMKDLLARTAPAAADGRWEGYKVSDLFDGTAKHPWWLDTASLA